MLAIGRLSLVVPDAPTPWPGEDDARIVGTRLDHAVPAYETGELTRADWPLRLLRNTTCTMHSVSHFKRPGKKKRFVLAEHEKNLNADVRHTCRRDRDHPS